MKCEEGNINKNSKIRYRNLEDLIIGEENQEPDPLFKKYKWLDGQHDTYHITEEDLERAEICNRENEHYRRHGKRCMKLLDAKTLVRNQIINESENLKHKYNMVK